MLKTFDEMTPEQKFAYKIGYDAARRDLANGERVEPDYEAAVQMWWGMLGREGQSPEPNTVLAKLIVDAAIGDKLLVSGGERVSTARAHAVEGERVVWWFRVRHADARRTEEGT